MSCAPSETDFRLVECFDPRTNGCTLTPSCRLKHLFDEALQAYFLPLDGATLADMTAGVPTSKRHPTGGTVARRPATAVAMSAPRSRARPANALARSR